MFGRLGNFVTRHWLLTILCWLGLLLVLRGTAPRWDEIAHDGDLEYLPAAMPSVVGQKLLTAAFPDNRARSQMVVVVARDDGKLDLADLSVAHDLARRFQNLAGAANLSQARQLALPLPDEGPADPLREARREQAAQVAAEALDEAVRLDEAVAEHWESLRREAEETGRVVREQPPPRLAAAWHNRALLAELSGDDALAQEERQRAALLDPGLAEASSEVLPADAPSLPILDVWTWRDPLFGEHLTSADQAARLIVLHLSNEFMATDNIRVLQRVEQELKAVRDQIPPGVRPGLRIGISGSAAVGGDMLRAAAESIRNTELWSVVLVLLILVAIYRSPLLIAVPLLTIVTALLISTSLVAWLTRFDQLPGFGWWELKVFTTTKIFVVVILFGAGTDYCLFLIARYREELEKGGERSAALVRALTGVGDALAASALTTILGLATMYFADFGKFRYSGPVIGLCLAVTLLTCITLTPALLQGLGLTVFWPSRTGKQRADAGSSPGRTKKQPADAGRSPDWAEKQPAAAGRSPRRVADRFWDGVARVVLARPGLTLVLGVLLLLPLAWRGFWHFTPWPGVVGPSRVSYDFLNSLADDRPSKQGARLLQAHFPVGETGPVTVLLYRPGPALDSQQVSHDLRQLSDALHLPGVRAVRSLADPLGEYEPGEKPGLLSERGRRLRLLKAHWRTKSAFVSHQPQLDGSVTRLELILEQDPFSLDAIGTLRLVDQRLRELTGDPQSFWNGARFSYAGTTAGLRDLRAVTQSDNLRIEVLVVLAVLGVLLVILRRPLISLYMIATVLLSFYVTIGATDLFFGWTYGEQFAGLDWKVPLFLFVILVAVGQDYNVYLATRVFEEQVLHGPLEGLRRAVIQTGGIITSCGLIMAGTFLSMTSGTWVRLLSDWFPALERFIPSSAGSLRGIVEMGFALALGVLIDTLFVRTVLVPAFLALLCRRQSPEARERVEAPGQ
ncbi:MAG: MMPL family transporter [Pirellulaceae bacterium]|nr:MMPL family transporter [Pirellulaceae bacterium]